MTNEFIIIRGDVNEYHPVDIRERIINIRWWLRKYAEKEIKIKEFREALKQCDVIVSPITIRGWIYKKLLRTKIRKRGKRKYHRISIEEVNKFLDKMEKKFEEKYERRRKKKWRRIRSPISGYRNKNNEDRLRMLLE